VGTVLGAFVLYALLIQGRINPDLGIGRRTRPLGPLTRHIDAPPEVVFDVIAAPYLGKTPRAMASKLKVLERGSDMVLAAHYTKTTFGLTATTVETVRFERPGKVYFQLVRGPVPAVSESFELVADGTGTLFHYTGELGTDLWALGSRWGDRVAAAWESAVASSVASITAEAERRAG
jgi:hypothetical protein